MRRSIDCRRTSEAAASVREKRDLEERIMGKAEMVTQLQKSVILKEERLKEIQVGGSAMVFCVCVSVCLFVCVIVCKSMCVSV